MACFLNSDACMPNDCRVHSSTACSMVMVCSRNLNIIEFTLESSRMESGLAREKRRSRMVPSSRVHISKGSEMDSASSMVPTTL